MKRRDFVKKAGQGIGAAAFSTAFGSKRPAQAGFSPNEKIVVGLIGCGGQGGAHMMNLAKRQDAEVAAVCDVYKPRYETYAKRTGSRCEGYQDYRRILDRDDIDAVFIATPDHWHALMTIHACQAGKDVYVEKPLTTTIYEGRKAVEAARRYGRVVQNGIQQRSMEVFKRSIDLIRSGKLGQVTTARSWIGPNGGMSVEVPGDPPEGLDWDMWLGPAPWVPFSPQRFGGFRFFEDYAGGELTNWGPHLMDIALWGLGQDKPLSIQGTGVSPTGLPGSDPQNLEVVYEFKGATLTWSQAPNQTYAGKGYGTLFHGTAGRLIVNRESYVLDPPSIAPEYKSEGEFFIRLEEHHTNFFECMRSRELPAADIEIGHRSDSLCLLGNIAVDLKRRLVWDGDAERFIGDEQANRYLYRPYRAPWHL
jgi:predicted dehydrogenase